MEKVEKDFILFGRVEKDGGKARNLKLHLPSYIPIFVKLLFLQKCLSFLGSKESKSSLPRRDKEGEGCPGQDERTSSAFLEIFEGDNIYGIKSKNSCLLCIKHLRSYMYLATVVVQLYC